jgi:hypothetical protein
MEKRSFFYDGQEYFINTPSAMVIREADWAYSKIYTKALQEGIPTASEMQDILKKRGIIGPEYDDRAVELATELDNILAKMDSEKDDDIKRKLALDASEIRNEIFMWNQRLNGPMANTCEQMADDSRLESITAGIVVDKDGNKVWEDHDAFVTTDKGELAATAKFEVMLFLQGLDSDFLEKVPENEVMRDLDNKATEAINKKDAKKVKSKKTKSKKADVSS